MIARILSILVPVGLTASAQAAGETSFRIKLRALLHDPLNPAAELYVQGAGTTLERLNLSLEGLSEPQEVTITDGSLRLFSSTKIDPKKPLANLAATTPAADTLKQAIALIVPSGNAGAPAYRMMLLNDAPSVFPMGESRVINLTSLELAFRAGEHRKPVKPASVETIPKVTKVNDMNQAQTLFYQKSGEDWTLLSERPTQFTEKLRNLFLLYTMPNVPEAQVRTVIDTQESRP